MKKFLNDDKMFFRVALLGIILAMFSMFMCIDNSLDNVQDDVRVIIAGNQSVVCEPIGGSNQLVLQCSAPDYNYLLDNLYK